MENLTRRSLVTGSAAGVAVLTASAAQALADAPTIHLGRMETFVTSKSPDGAYYWAGNYDDPIMTQLVVVGPMKFSPGDYRRALEKTMGSKLQFVELIFLNGADHAKDVVQERGFVAMIFEKIA